VIRDFRLINSALAQPSNSDPFPDYKALVCIHLGGGNDGNNFIVPRGSAYPNYAAVRQNLAIPEVLLHPISPLNGDGNEYGFHPNCRELASLFNSGKLATLFNVGPLLFPTDRNQYKNKLIPLPPQLFSHSDQVTHWQTSLPDQPPRTGWGGRIADILHPHQNELLSDLNDRSKISLCTSIAGANTFEVGSVVQQFHVSTGGAVTLNGVTAGSTRETTIRSIAQASQQNLQMDAFGDILDSAVATSSTSSTSSTAWTIPFPNSTLGNQLKIVARMIAGRDTLKIKRQIFFVSVGGYDTHTSQLGDAANPGNALFGAQADLLNKLSESIGAFQAAMEQLAVQPPNASLPNSEVGFTASDFGRTLPTNGQGSDHGWGSHHVIFGGSGNPTTGAVRGQRIYGTFPVLQVNGPDDTSTGRWIPRTSVDEYSATLAKWFGVNSTYMPVVFPNLSRFAMPDLGFMNA
jgi:uncharacterized protein (DUF1501 family)